MPEIIAKIESKKGLLNLEKNVVPRMGYWLTEGSFERSQDFHDTGNSRKYYSRMQEIPDSLLHCD